MRILGFLLILNVPAPASPRPIHQLARVFDSRLRDIEGRIVELETRIRVLDAPLSPSAIPGMGPLALPVLATGKALLLRDQVELHTLNSELAALLPIREDRSARSEQNIIWASGLALTLIAVLPFAILDRRRLSSRIRIETLRKRIAAELHNDIGSNLGSISLIARTVRKNLDNAKPPTAFAEDMEEIESIARESSLAMRDIVWLLERHQDTIGDLVNRMRETGRVLPGLEFSMECATTQTASRLHLDAKRHLYFFYKEAIHGVVRYSQARKVEVRVHDEGPALVLEIADNGVGLPDDPMKRPPAIQKLQERARVLAGSLQIASVPGHSTLLRLTVNRSQLFADPAHS